MITSTNKPKKEKINMKDMEGCSLWEYAYIYGDELKKFSFQCKLLIQDGRWEWQWQW